MPIASLESVSKTYPAGRRVLGVRLGGAALAPVQALDEVTVAFERGEIVGLLGPNGAGKSTIMRLLAGVITPTAGRVAVDALVGGAARDDRAFSQRLSGRENLRFFAGLDDLDPAETSDRIAAVLESVGLSQRADRGYRTYSSGMRQALAIARALLREPELLLLDEASTGLDPGARSRLHERLRELASGGMTIVFATHQLGEACSLCDRLVLLHGGKVRGTGAPDELTEGIEALFV